MDAGKFNAAADTLQREANRFHQLAEAAQVMRDAGAVFSQLDEAQDSLAKLREATAAARSDLEQCAEDIESARTRAAAIVGQANEDAKQRLDEAEEQAQGRLGAAKDQAEAIIVQAKGAAAAMVDAAEARVSRHDAELAAKGEAVKALDDELSARSEELANLERKIAEARRLMAGFVHG